MPFFATRIAISLTFILANSFASKLLSLAAKLSTNTAFPIDILFSLANLAASTVFFKVWFMIFAFISFLYKAKFMSSNTSSLTLLALSKLSFLTVTNIPVLLFVIYPFWTIEPISAFTATLSSVFFKFIPSITLSPSLLVACTSKTLFFLFVTISTPGFTSMSTWESGTKLLP